MLAGIRLSVASPSMPMPLEVEEEEPMLDDRAAFSGSFQSDRAETYMQTGEFAMTSSMPTMEMPSLPRKDKATKDKSRSKDKDKAQKSETQKRLESMTMNGSLRSSSTGGSGSIKSGSLSMDMQEPWRKLIKKSWRALDKSQDKGIAEEDAEAQDAAAGAMGGSGALGGQVASSTKQAGGPDAKQAPKKSGGWFGWGKSSAKKGHAGEGEEKEGEGDSHGAGSSGDGVGTLNGMGGFQQLPETFNEMVLFNVRMMGANESWITMVLDQFEVIQAATVQADEARLELEANLLGMRMSKGVTGKIKLDEFRVCMLASLRSLLPKIWSNDYENAWTNMWEALHTKLEVALPLPHKYAKPVVRMVDDLQENEKGVIAMAIFKRLFNQIQDTENYFKQNNARLIYIVGKALDMSAEIYEEPSRMITDVYQLGLRHIMLNVPPEYFEPFVLCVVLELEERGYDRDAVDGIAYALTQISSIMVRVIVEGATPLIRAVLANSPKKVKKALGGYAREDRAKSSL